MKIEDSIAKLTAAMHQEKAIAMNDHGEWHTENMIVRLIKWILGLRDKRALKVCQTITSYLDSIEKRPILFKLNPRSFHSQKVRLNSYIDLSHAAIKYVKKYRSKKIAKYRNLIERRLVGLQYRMEWKNGGLKPLSFNEVNSKIFNLLVEKASKWKSKQKIYNQNGSCLHPLDIEKLKEACCYDAFAALLFVDNHLMNDFFCWALKNCNPVKEYVEYPATCLRLKTCLLYGRIGRFAYQNVLSSEKVPLFKNASRLKKKIITLPFEGLRISILNENLLIKFQGNHWAAIGDVLHDIAMKNTKPGEFEFIGSQGFTSWSSHKMGRWNALKNQWDLINLSKNRWWESLPIQETIDAEEITKRYEPSSPFNENNWILLARSSRQTNSYNLDDCHGYTGILVPDGKGKWRVYDFGKFAKVWPKGILGHLGMVCNTVKADYVYPDPNIFYSGFRQQALISFIVSEEQGVRFFNERIKKNIIKGRKGNLVFMFGWENCAYTPQVDLEAILGKQSEGGMVPNLFISPVLSSSSRKPLYYTFKIIKKLPKKFHRPLVRICDLALLSWRGVNVEENGKIKKKSLNSSPYQKGHWMSINGKLVKVDQHIFLPSHLHRQIEKGNIPGVIWSGHHRMQVLHKQ